VIVVSDSSPLINLAAVGHFEVLKHLFSTVLIPPAVYREVVEAGEGRAGVEDVLNAPWIQEVPVRNQSFADVLKRELDAGEAEAIALALEQEANIVLLDERQGRRRAEAFGLRITGVAGLLIEAKRQELLKEVGPVLMALRDEAGFWMSDHLYHEVLVLAGETK
jgi:hypothetical protein